MQPLSTAKENPVPEVNDLLDAERNRRRPAAGRARIALIITGAATVVALGTGATLAVTAATSLMDHEVESAAAGERLASIAEALPTVEPDATAVQPSATALPAEAQPAQNEFGFPIYDASTDIATIPRPADDPDPANTEIWLAQQGIIADCMLEEGFDYRFTVYWLVPPGSLITWEQRSAALGEAEIGTAEFAALHGVSEFGPDDPAVAPEYRWEDAGCHGYAVHVTGMDDAH